MPKFKLTPRPLTPEQRAAVYRANALIRGYYASPAPAPFDAGANCVKPEDVCELSIPLMPPRDTEKMIDVLFGRHNGVVIAATVARQAAVA